MKIGNALLSLLLIFSLLNFSPHRVGATDSEEEQEVGNELIEEGIEVLKENELEEHNSDSGDELVEEVVKDASDVESLEFSSESEQENIEEAETNSEEVVTQNLSVSTFSTVVLKNGVRHTDVKTLKANLKKLGFTVPGNGTTLFGPETEKKVKEFQSYYNLGDIDGIAGPATLVKIDSILASPLQNGKRHNDTKTLKVNLATLGFKVPGNGTTLYGKDTEKRVKDFQKHYGLVVNGIADEVTLAKIAELLPSELQNGVRHKDVQTLKANLAKLGFPVPGKGTTLFGKDTERKVKEFQSYYGLKADGIAGKSTLAKIDSILSSPLQNGKRHNDTKTLKANLATLGFKVPGNGTTLYGKNTENRVRDFQKHHGLVVNGIADEVTLAKIAELLPSELQNGVRHRDVQTLKTNLAKLGFPVPGKGTTLFGKDTEQKVKEFQSYYGLKVDGVAGKSTLAKIDSILASPLQNGKRHNETKILKANLATLGFKVPGNGTTLYGKDTEKKVKEFQKYYGLVTNGIADEITLKKISSLISQLPKGLQNGVRHKDVKKLKADLGRLGFPVPGNGTTYFGNDTEKKVREFQTYYGLSVNGVADDTTLAKIKSVLSSPLQNGQRHKDTIKLKKDLAKVGYPVPGDGTNYFGKGTEKQLKAYQKFKKLPTSGIADEGTLRSIAADIKQLQVPTYTKYDITLEQALIVQMNLNTPPQTDKYRNEKAYVHGNYIHFIGLISGNNSNLRSQPTTSSTRKFSGLAKGTKVTIEGQVKGQEFRESNIWYKVKYKNETVYAHSSILDPSNNLAQTTDKLNVRAATNMNSHVYKVLAKGTEVTILKKGGTWHEISLSTWRNATSADVERYLNPNNNDQFQHLMLSASVGVPASELNKVLAGKGVLSGLGQAFIDGGKTHSINEIYLISHALLETGHGTSRLATGIEVGKNKSGNPVLVTTSNRSSLTNIKKTYNMFGIGAADADPNRLGAIRAYNEGWYTPEAAIKGGTKFIGERYIHNAYQQNTLYKMRWNPANPGYPQYATDMAWAVKQVSQIKNMYNQLDDPLLQFDIVQYK